MAPHVQFFMFLGHKTVKSVDSAMYRLGKPTGRFGGGQNIVWPPSLAFGGGNGAPLPDPPVPAQTHQAAPPPM